AEFIFDFGQGQIGVLDGIVKEGGHDGGGS
ncbi:MAG: hypothetical protein RLZZ617_62, partial [Bacteroidota bacterium]